MKTVSLSLPDSIIDRLDEVATTERRSRSNAAVVLIERALAANQRPASDSLAVSGSVQGHLRRHAELSGFDPPFRDHSQETPDHG